MKKIGIITKIDNNNYGNRLQNYALDIYLRKNFKEYEVVTLKNLASLNNDEDSKLINYFKRIKHLFLKKIIGIFNKRLKCFIKFNKNIQFSSHTYDKYHLPKDSDYDFLIIGSDQVWNYNFDIPNLFFGSFKNDNVNSYSASFGVSNIPHQYWEKYKKGLQNLENISVREEEGKKIVEDLIKRKNIEVHIDPTMLLSEKDWLKVAKRPKQLKSKKYILNYFLGPLTESRKNAITKIAKENHCEIINLYDRKSEFYNTGPSEFLYLEKNAFLICTDSFHASVFAIIFNRPFVIFDRIQKQGASMSSRIDTLINKFKLENRKFNEKEITEENLKHDYSQAFNVLEKEKEKSKRFFDKIIPKKNLINYYKGG